MMAAGKSGNRMTVILIVVGAIVLALVLMYNTLVQRRNAIENSFGAVDAYLQMRYDLIPNLVEVVKGYVKHERETLERVTALRQQAQSPKLDTDQRVRLDNQLREATLQLIARAEAYPDLKASTQFLQLQRSLNEVEERISASRRAFNAAVLDYNNSVETFPSNLVANSFGFKRRAFFATDEVARVAPAVALP